MHKELKNIIFATSLAIPILLLITSCMGSKSVNEISISPEESPIAYDEVSATKPVADGLSLTIENSTHVPTQIGPLPALTGSNVANLHVSAKILPFFPPHATISGNHEVFALGDLNGVHVYNTSRQDKLMTIDAELPDCRFGLDTYLALDHAGEFIAFTTNTGIEVWQIGGGRIFQSPFIHGKTLDPLTCGLDIPQIALSPQGKLLAESGLGAGGEEYGDYFRVTDVTNNSVVYSWNDDTEKPFGQLQTFQTLGFSSDGRVLHTFDPFNFQPNANNGNESFLFWSTENWRSVASESSFVRGSFNPEVFFYSISDAGFVKIFDKASNLEVAVVESEGCNKEYPCNVIFSPDGSKFGILKQTGEIQYKRETLITSIDIYDLNQAKKRNSIEILLRNKNGIRLENNGDIILAQHPISDNPTWWTHTAYLNRLFNVGDETIGFIPQVIDVFADNPPYAGTCQIDNLNDTLSCAAGVRQSDGTILSIEQISGGFVLLDGDQSIAQVKYPAGSGQDLWQIRLKAYNQHTGAGYFCLDRNLREETCVVMNFLDKRIILEQIDLFGFIQSTENDLSIFIDRDKKELNIFYEESNRSVQMRSYQAIAYSAKPALVAGGDRAFYIVQNVENKNLYLEEISLQDAKVIKRYDFGFLSDINPTVIAVNGPADLLAVGDDTGSIYFLDLSTSELVHNMVVTNTDVVDLIFSGDDKRLVVMDAAGKISILQVMQ